MLTCILVCLSTSGVIVMHKRALLLFTSLLTLFFIIWFELLIQRNQQLIGGGINRIFIFLFINIHIILVIALLYLIIKHSIKLFIERQHNHPGSAFKKTLLFTFTFLTVLPSFFIFFAARKFITRSIDDWFHARINTGLESALVLHQAHTRSLRTRLSTMGNAAAQSAFVNNRLITKSSSLSSIKIKQAKQLYPELAQYEIYLWPQPTAQACEVSSANIGSLRDEMEVWRQYRQRNDRSIASLKKLFLEEVTSLSQDNGKLLDFYGSLYWMKKLDDYLLMIVYRYPTSLRFPLLAVQASLIDYRQLKSMRNPIYVTYLLTFILITLFILFFAIWCAFYLARGISKPIKELLEAMQQIKQGHWVTNVSNSSNTDMNMLTNGFNEMTQALKIAYCELTKKHEEMLMILESINAPVFFINRLGRLTMSNKAAKQLVATHIGEKRFKNKKIWTLGATIKDHGLILARALIHSGVTQLSQQISLAGPEGNHLLMVHLTMINTSHTLGYQEKGFLVVIEDLTNVVKMSKLKTWQEAAQQLAHEIKNPLTPIQLATQRLQRKYKDVFAQDSVFAECTTTILHHVNIIKKLASHFSQFASLPAPHLELINLKDLIIQTVNLYIMSYPAIEFSCSLLHEPALIVSDRQKCKQVLVNLLDNSVRALSSLTQPSYQKSISIKTKTNIKRHHVDVIISDNGPGICPTIKDKLFLPYVSSSKKNMGLGLAIVQDIVTQLEGTIRLLPTTQGATFHITLPLREKLR